MQNIDTNTTDKNDVYDGVVVKQQKRRRLIMVNVIAIASSVITLMLLLIAIGLMYVADKLDSIVVSVIGKSACWQSKQDEGFVSVIRKIENDAHESLQERRNANSLWFER